MRRLLLVTLAVLLIGGSLALLFARRSPPQAPASPPGSEVASASSVSGNGFTLTSTSIEPPADDATFPPGPHVDVVNQNCLSCHSASMVLTQPALKPEQWTAIVEKMRDVYKAPIAAGDVPAITAYLAGLGAGKTKPGD